jgi:hypothetical protein
MNRRVMEPVDTRPDRLYVGAARRPVRRGRYYAARPGRPGRRVWPRLPPDDLTVPPPLDDRHRELNHGARLFDRCGGLR